MIILKSKFIQKAFILELIVTLLFVLWCFGKCDEYVFSAGELNKCSGGVIDFGDGTVGIEAQGLEEADLLDCSLVLRGGAYHIKVLYQSVSNYDNVSIDNCAGTVVLGTKNASVLRSSSFRLRDGLDEAESRFWIRPHFGLWFEGTDEIRIAVRYFGNGKLAIKEIQVEEKREYRVLVCLAVICTMLVCNLFYLCFIKNLENFEDSTRIVIAGIVGITFFSSMPYFAEFVKSGHDLEFHISRIVSLANALGEFQIPHRIQFEMLNGYGYAMPLYYGELFLLLPAVLYQLYLPLSICYQIFVVTVNFATAIISYWCFMKMSNDWKKGLAGSLIYTLSAYRLTNVMVRAAVGEYTAMIFLPLLLYGFWRIYSKNKNETISIKECLPIILAATGIINSHVLSCEMVLLFVVVFALVHWKKTFTKHIFMALLKSAFASLLFNIWFIVPFLQSQKMGIDVNGRAYRIESTGVYLSRLFGMFHIFGGGMLLSIGMTFDLSIVIFLFVFIKKKNWKLECTGNVRAAAECFALGLLALFLASSLCRWDDLAYVSKKIADFFGMVQFAWRYLGIATVFLATMIIFLLQILEEHMDAYSYRWVMFVLIAATVIGEGHFLMEYVNVQGEIRYYSSSDVGTMSVSGAEYVRKGTDLNAYKNRNIAYAEGMENVEFSYGGNGTYYLKCSNKTDEAVFLDVPVQSYDNYRIYMDNEEELAWETGENNRIRLAVPGNYDGTIRIKYVVPVLWRLCELVSLAAWGILIVMLLQRFFSIFEKFVRKLSL